MWPATSQVSLLRYLVVWRVNAAFVQLPRCLPADISRVLGTLIAERLPTQQAKPWRKALAGWGLLNVPDAAAARSLGPNPGTSTANAAKPAKSKKPTGRRPAADEVRAPSLSAGAYPVWPIESVLWPYPGKRAYGQGEPILWELKLLGAAADHGLFLEVILPAMEAAATASDERWHQSRGLWGRFDVQAIYAARGPCWEPFVTGGRLDLAYRPTPAQWAEGLTFEPDSKRRYHRLNWLTPFDFGMRNADGGMRNADGGMRMADFGSDSEPDIPKSEMPETEGHAVRNPKSSPPSLRAILDAYMARLASLILGKWATAEQAWAQLGAEEQAGLLADCAEGRPKQHTLEPASKDWPGRWIGAQVFAKISPRLMPYLELASILHVGKHTHFGCGTFGLE
jgi:hypothetical protein